MKRREFMGAAATAAAAGAGALALPGCASATSSKAAASTAGRDVTSIPVILEVATAGSTGPFGRKAPG